VQDYMVMGSTTKIDSHGDFCHAARPDLASISFYFCGCVVVG